MLQLSTAIVAGLFSIFVTLVSLYRTPPEKRIVALQEAIDGGGLSPSQVEQIEEAIDRQVRRLGLPDYGSWFLYWAVGGTLGFVAAAFFVGLLADDLGKLIFYFVFGIYVIVSMIFGLAAAVSVFRRARRKE